MAYDNNMTGIISKNERKEKDSHPDIKGSCEINGKQFWISGWMKVRNDGEGRFYSLRFEPKEAQKEMRKPSHDAAKARQLPHRAGFDESDVPF